MNQKFDDFRNYHYQDDPLLLANVWDASSTKLYEKLGFKAIGTSSSAVSALLGYEDGENMPFNEYLMIISRIVESTNLPVSVDIEAGHGSDAEKVFQNIKALSQLGVVGINLEDSVVEEGTRSLVDADVFVKKLQSVREKLNNENIDIFINLRIDSFLLQLPNALKDAKERIDTYSDFIDGVFLPCITSEEDIAGIISHTRLPLNVLSVPGLPDFKKLKNLGVKRISTGNSLYDFMHQQLEEKIAGMTA